MAHSEAEPAQAAHGDPEALQKVQALRNLTSAVMQVPRTDLGCVAIVMQLNL